jgi:hypothetical protein
MNIHIDEMTYSQRASHIGEHWTWFFNHGRRTVEIYVPVELAGGDSFSDDSYFKAKGIAVQTFVDLGGNPNRTDVCSSPEESRKQNFPPGLDTIGFCAEVSA